MSAHDDLERLARIAIDCGMKIHQRLGPGLLESVYERLLADSLTRHGITVDRQVPISFEFDNIVFNDGFRADLMLDNKLIIEIKSIDRLAPVHTRQLLTYLRLTEGQLGLLLNFGGETFKEGIKRIVNNYAP
ncbi:MAG: GxxExxY protein [Chakrabartia sp.]